MTHLCIKPPNPNGIVIYTSTGSFSLEGEGWDEGDITGLFYSPHPNPLQQERVLMATVTYYFIVYKLCRYLCPAGEGVR